MVRTKRNLLTKKLDKPEGPVPLKYLSGGRASYNMECKFCQDNINRVDYKNTQFLRKYVTSQFKIATSRRNQLCNKHQRRVAEAVKLARFMAIMPYTRNQTVK